MSNYTVNFVVKEWVDIQVKAQSEEQAIDAARGMLHKDPGYRNKRITIIDCKIVYAGAVNNSIIDTIDL